MTRVLEYIALVLLFMIGWISGGGIAAFAVMAIIELWLGTDFNTSFVGGCLWGSFGVLAGRFMFTTYRRGMLVPKEVHREA